MKLDVISHCTIDTIEINDSKYVVPGGPGCYCSLTAKALKFDVKLHTKFGSDFTYADYLTKQKIVFENAFSNKLTTRFRLQLVNSERTLFLENKCEVINEQTNLNLSGISAIKVNSDELRSLTNSSNLDGIKILQKKGISNVILTDKQNISLLSEDKIYSITLPDITLNDTTGIGDIFSSTFCCIMLKEKDILWALSFAGGAAQAALESGQIGLEKIPSKGAIESNAYYFYNTIKFKEI